MPGSSEAHAFYETSRHMRITDLKIFDRIGMMLFYWTGLVDFAAYRAYASQHWIILALNRCDSGGVTRQPPGSVPPSGPYMLQTVAV